MKNAKTKGWVSIVAFLALTVLCAYTVIYGIGVERKGKASNIKLGLDLAGGVSITYEIQNENPSDTDIADTIYRLQQRVDTYSTEGEVYKEGSNRINIEIPGVTDANAILEELGRPGSLEFLDQTNFELWANNEAYEVALSGTDVKSATAAIDNSGTSNEYLVQLSFTTEGAAKFAEITAANVGKIIYIVYDNQVVSYPTVQSAITSETCQIDHMESFETAEQLATTIRIGALPLELKELRSNVVGAKLGEDAIRTTLIAGAIGIGIVCLIMIIVYYVPGVVSSLALIAYVILTLLCLNGFNVTLTLPGLAGIVLSIGMAVDANVIVFTRIKEELATGKSVKLAIKSGFDKALSAILDGNITTLIAAAVLWWRGTGSIKGFAQTLAIGIVLSMFTALVITKLLLNSACALGLNKVKLYGTAKTPKVRNYCKISKYCFVGSALVIVLGLVFLPINKSNEKVGDILNYSLEFKGGTSITSTFDKAYTLAEAESELIPVITEATGISGSEIQLQTVADANQVVIKTSELTVDQREAVEDALKNNFTIVDFSTENISSTVSSEMKVDAIMAVIIATIFMLIYIAFRFKDVKFGASAVIALLHDVLVVFTLYSVARLSVGNTFIACMLTIVGYSINATIIIFDRIRENLVIMNPKKDGYEAIVNASISQTFTRTIFTSLTTFVMVFVLYILGVPSIKEFALTLMAGIVCGAYSSVCITGPLWFILKTKLVKKAEATNNKTNNKKPAANTGKSNNKNKSNKKK